MSKFAAQTSVSVEKSQQEIRTLLTRYGANQYMTGDDNEVGRSFVQFIAQNRSVRFVLTLPERSEKRFWYTSGRHVKRSENAAYQEWEQACRQKWRALVLCIKAKLEAVESGISQFEDEFLAHIVLPTGGTVGELIRPQIEESYRLGSMPAGISGFLSGPKSVG